MDFGKESCPLFSSRQRFNKKFTQREVCLYWQNDQCAWPGPLLANVGGASTPPSTTIHDLVAMIPALRKLIPFCWCGADASRCV